MSKKVILLRHAPAMDRAEFSKKFKKDDFHRPLTNEGVESFEGLLERINAQKKYRKKLKEYKIFCSPFIRTQQTADLINKKFKMKSKTVEVLSHGTSPEKLLEFIQKTKKKHILLVGHEPELSAVEALSKKKPAKTFKKGEMRGYKLSNKKLKKKWKMLPHS